LGNVRLERNYYDPKVRMGIDGWLRL
jgi:hypothetical protein